LLNDARALYREATKMLHEGFNSRKMPWLVVSWMSMVKEKEKKKTIDDAGSRYRHPDF
jgi:hypothetical protein